MSKPLFWSYFISGIVLYLPTKYKRKTKVKDASICGIFGLVVLGSNEESRWCLQQVRSSIPPSVPTAPRSRSRSFRLAGRTINGLVVRASACQAGDPVSNPDCAVFPVQPVALRLPEFSGKELEYCLCYLIEWGEILPVKRRGA